MIDVSYDFQTKTIKIEFTTSIKWRKNIFKMRFP